MVFKVQKSTIVWVTVNIVNRGLLWVCLSYRKLNMKSSRLPDLYVTCSTLTVLTQEIQERKRQVFHITILEVTDQRNGSGKTKEIGGKRVDSGFVQG